MPDDKGNNSSSNNIWVQIIIGIVAIILALIPFWCNSKNNTTSTSTSPQKSKKDLTFSGTIISDNGDQVAGALLTVAGQNESAYSQSNGNFSISLNDSNLTEIEVLVSRKGYATFDKKFDLPSSAVIIALRDTTRSKIPK